MLKKKKSILISSLCSIVCMPTNSTSCYAPSPIVATSLSSSLERRHLFDQSKLLYDKIGLSSFSIHLFNVSPLKI